MQSRLKWSIRPIITYTMLFGILSIFIFAPYYFTDTSLIWQSDGIAQHFPALVRWQEDLKNIIQPVFHSWLPHNIGLKIVQHGTIKLPYLAMFFLDTPHSRHLSILFLLTH